MSTPTQVDPRNDDAAAGPTDAAADTERTFPPSPEFVADAVAHEDLHDAARSDRPAFWGEQARTLLDWRTPFTQTLDWSGAPFATWFADGTLNVAENCLDRHVRAGNGDRVAIHFEGAPGDTRRITYAELTADVQRAANMLTDLGVTQGDRVVVYMPLIPEAVVTMLAVARIGAVHSVVFGGFSAESLRARIEDAGAKLVVTADGGWRRGAVAPLKPAVDEALAGEGTDSVEHVLVVRRGGNEVAWDDARDLWWHDVFATADAHHDARAFPAENPLFILYTSGTTGKPKGIVHTSGGYLTQATYTHRNVFDIHPDKDVYWCTADIGWITGHTYVVYGPLANGVTQVLYEGTPDEPQPGRWWDIVDSYGVTVLYTAPTAVRAAMKGGRQVPDSRSLDSLRLLGSVGEPINPEAWHWFRQVIGHDRTPIVDTWWQTETGAIMISALPGVTKLKPGAAQTPLPGIVAEIVDEDGHRADPGESGYLTITEPWPSMARGIWNDPDRFVETYWDRFPGRYFAGDGARLDGQGDIWVQGRVDDVMNVSGHRLSTAEIESALVGHEGVAEAAVVGAADETTGQAIVAFVILTTEAADGVDRDAVAAELRAWVGTRIGAIAKPKQVVIVPELPKTRSGKIMRRLLRDAAEGRKIGDTTTLADPTIMATITDLM
ncbi:acetyl-coenzyme A synthetase [Curtobacterium sp. Leaf183]|uniref:acetate--CoA ligase n=1 Tax=Curtobacterium sp. Leaf183 TaxID=1736291 RepID=UPI0006FF0560|nr:acetate--CoA ligase [Curtobacterium sp. Leaf183]KQS14402.1 acetyl-coenzyme A synthetase [Curtobacterium sp. Leaf183]